MGRNCVVYVWHAVMLWFSLSMLIFWCNVTNLPGNYQTTSKIVPPFLKIWGRGPSKFLGILLSTSGLNITVADSGFPRGCANLLFMSCFPKTARNWKNCKGAHHWCPLFFWKAFNTFKLKKIHRIWKLLQIFLMTGKLEWTLFCSLYFKRVDYWHLIFFEIVNLAYFKKENPLV